MIELFSVSYGLKGWRVIDGLIVGSHNAEQVTELCA